MSRIHIIIPLQQTCIHGWNLPHQRYRNTFTYQTIQRHIGISQFGMNLEIDCYIIIENHTPVNTVMASSFLLASLGYDSLHLCHIPLTLNFGINSTCITKNICYHERNFADVLLKKASLFTYPKSNVNVSTICTQKNCIKD